MPRVTSTKIKAKAKQRNFSQRREDKERIKRTQREKGGGVLKGRDNSRPESGAGQWFVGTTAPGRPNILATTIAP